MRKKSIIPKLIFLIITVLVLGSILYLLQVPPFNKTRINNKYYATTFSEIEKRYEKVEDIKLYKIRYMGINYSIEVKVNEETSKEDIGKIAKELKELVISRKFQRKLSKDFLKITHPDNYPGMKIVFYQGNADDEIYRYSSNFNTYLPQSSTANMYYDGYHTWREIEPNSNDSRR